MHEFTKKTHYIQDLYIYIYVYYIIHCKFKRHNHQVPKTVRVAGNKTNTKKRKEKFTNNASNYNKHRMY